MPSQRANVTKIAGLYTYLSELSAPEGALVKANNVNINEMGVLTPRRGLNDYGAELTQTADRVKQILEYKERIIRHFDTTLEFDDGTGNFTAFSGSFSEVEPGFRLKFKEANGNLYFTSDTGIKKISAKRASDFSSSINYIQNAGAPKAVDLQATTLPSTGGFLPPQSKVAYKVLFGYTDANNNLILGSPSVRQVVTNTSQDTFTKESIFINFISDEDDSAPANINYLGKGFILYSQNNKYHVWYNDGLNNYTEPNNAETIGSTPIEVIIGGSDTAQTIANTTANKIDAEIGTLFEVQLDTVNSDITLISKEDGEIEDPTQGTINSLDMTIEVLQQGSITEGTNVNVQLSFIIPDGVTTNYFYQIYRTNNVTAIEGLTVNDIDPGEDANLVIENPVTVAPGNIVTVTDTTPSTFRDTGVPLYNNPISGQGLLQTNDRPPIAKDIETFSNYTFYANTKTFHRFTFNIVSVDDFGDLETRFVVSNEDGIHAYTFQGQQEITTINTGTVDDTAETNGNDSYITLSSANNERKYYVWFDKGTGIDPAIADSIGIRVNLAGAGVVGTDNVSEYIAAAFTELDDFNVVENPTSIVITNLNNGESDNADTPTSDASVDIGTGWSIVIDNEGTGEDAAQNRALWSILPSVGQAIEETARSLVSVINQDANSPVNAFYLSGANDLPGKILLENKSLEDKPFYVSIDNIGTIGEDIGGEFNPNLPINKIPTISINSPDEALITLTNHGYLDSDVVYLYAPNNDPALAGIYTISNVTANTFTIEQQILTADSTNAFVFLTSQTSDNLETPNRIYYSKLGQPEAVPIVNTIDVGGKDKPIERILALRDSLFILKEDGTYILSGTAPFSVRLLDNTSTIIAPDSAVVMNNQIFCLNEDGIANINETGTSLISRSIENLILDVLDEGFDFRLNSFGVAYESDKAYFLFLPTKKSDTVATQAYRYNIFERTWTRWTVPATSGYVSSKNILYLGDGNRNYLLKERKNKDRTDFADRNFSLSIPNDSVIGTKVRVSNATEIEIGDVVVQEQPVTITLFNSLLEKLGLDLAVSRLFVTADNITDTFTATGHALNESDKIRLGQIEYFVVNPTVNTFQLSETQLGTPIDLDGTETFVFRIFDTYQANEGDNIATILNVFNQHLIDIGLNVTVQSFVNTDLDDLETKYNALIDELNDVNSGTRYKNYRKIEERTFYESIITNVDVTQNELTTLFETRFLEGPIEVYKSIATEVQWSPLHFGDPSSTKQISRGTVIMDQNNFTKATVSYSSDLSQGFVPINVTGKGVGYWSSATWGKPDLYWGGNGNDIPILNIIPREKQRCRYLNIKFEHKIARENYRVLGVTAVVRTVSERGYR